MEITDSRIDGGKSFDWGRTSQDYAKYRDIYPQEFYDRIIAAGLCRNGQRVLDVGTGTGVLPRNLYRYGAEWTASDISPEQIAQARRLSKEAGMEIDYLVAPTEKLGFADDSFDVITACQCFWYFDHARVMPMFSRMLRPEGRLLILYMAWLPYEDEIAGASEEIALKYNPEWSGAGETMHPIDIPEPAYACFELIHSEEYLLSVPFTRESWHGRMRACRGVGASLAPQELADWEKEHWDMLSKRAPESFEIKHYAAMAILGNKKG